MAVTIVRNPSKTGLVLLSSNVSVEDDGFVNIQSRWLAPSAGLAAGTFVLDSKWPIDSVPLPVGVPQIQDGPFLKARTIQKRDGLVFIDAVYVSAVSPVRIRVITSTQRASFSGYAEGPNDTSGSVSFDYTTLTRTYEYATTGSAQTISPVIMPGIIYNKRFEGNMVLVKWYPTIVINGTRDVVGKVYRYSITATGIYEQLQGSGTTFHNSVYMLDS